jgi:sterol desaturase/sphingolipid hydroxylase (fatty acid hydroxylase superfamily)
MLQLSLIFFIALCFLTVERIRPGRELPHVNGWYLRAIFFNACQLGIVVLAGISWNRWLQGRSITDIKTLPSVVQGFIGWFIGTFVFYWWHRARHNVGLFWRVFHQIHHSPARIETLTAFYKHPIDIAANSLISSALMFMVLGASVAGAAWYNVFAAAGEYFYHTNLKTPHWMGYFIQRPEHHSIHHQLDVHDFNYGDITLWDRLFGTFKETDRFVKRCGFPQGKENAFGKMLAFKDNYR